MASHSERSRGRIAALAGVVTMAAALAGCGGSDDDGGSAATATATRTATTVREPAGTTDRGARRCTRTAFLAALLVEVDTLAYRVDRVRCEGEFARSRFVAPSCPAGRSGVACGDPKIAAWRLGAKRWQLITYADSLSCSDVRRSEAKYPSTLCD